ncbi:MAG: Calx-beta domain-containing protein [Planctomycetota bacterium]
MHLAQTAILVAPLLVAATTGHALAGPTAPAAASASTFEPSSALVPDVEFAGATTTVTEGAGTVSIQVVLSEPATADVTVPYTVGGSADASDATVPAGPLVIGIGSSSGTIDVQVGDDSLSEGRERVVLTLDTPTGGVLGATIVHELVIDDDEPAATLAFDLASSSASEADGTVDLTLTLSSARTEDATVAFDLGGTATPGGVDLSVAPASPLLVPAGATTATLQVTIVDDGNDETDEDLVVTLTTADNCDVGAPGQHTLTVTDDDDPPTVSFSTPTSVAVETDAAVAIGVELSAVSAFDVTVPVTTGGTATDGVDYTWTPAIVTIPAGDMSGTVDVTPTDDADVEGTEVATFTLGAPSGATLGAQVTHDLQLVDDDGTPRVVAFQSASSSADEDAGVVSIVVEREDLSAQPLVVPVTVAGTATDTVDFDLLTPSVTIPVGALQVSAQVDLIDDTELEPAETVELTLGTPTGADLGATVVHTLTIQDDDPITATFALAAQSAAEGSGTALVDVTLSAPAPADVTVPLVLSGTAQAGGVDADVTPEPLVITTGQSAGQFAVALTPDALYEADETLVLTFGALSGAEAGAITEHVLTIENDDAPPVVEFPMFRTVVDEADGGFDVRIQLDAPSGLDVTVPFTVTGEAADSSDSTLPPSPAVVPAGATFVDLPVALVVDQIPELGETLTFTLEPPVDGTLGTTTTLLVLINDGDRGPMMLPPPLTPSVTELQYATLRVGEVSASQSVFFTNMHSAAVVLENVRLRGAMKGEFALSFPVALPITLQPGESAQVDVTFEPIGQGLRALDLEAEQQLQGEAPIPVRVSGIAYGEPGEEILMNADDEAFDGPGRTDWTAEYGVTGGELSLSGLEVLGTSLDGLYQTYRTGDSFDYALELPNGTYEVVLRTWEPLNTAPGLRVWDVELEGALALDDLDVFAQVGARTAYQTAAMRVDVADGILDIGIRASVARAIVSAVEVRSIPVLSTTTTSVGFGIVEQGSDATIDIVLQNDGLAPAMIDGLTFRTATDGSSTDFKVTYGGQDFGGGAVTVFHAPSIELLPGQTVVPVTFTPTVHEDHMFVLELESSQTGDMFEFDVSGTGGANPGWGFLHPVPDSSPTFVVDYDGSGSEEVQLLGAESHTHEPGKSLASFEWEVGGVPIASSDNTSHLFPTGNSTVTLTIGDDNTPPNFASDSRTITVHPVDKVPGPLALYYDGSTVDPVAMLSNVPATYQFAERLAALQVAPASGRIGGSPFTEDVMVRWETSFEITSARTLEFVAQGGLSRLVLVNGASPIGPVALAPGVHDVELRFAVYEIAELPLSLTILEGGSQAVDVENALFHDEQGVPPTIHSMPTIGSDLGGNRIDISGFGFFPRAQTVVHWGSIDITEAEFEDWGGERVVVNSPPGTGSVQVTIETPNGISDPVQFDYSPTGPVPIRFDRLDAESLYVQDATCAVWGPDGKLYVGVLNGSVMVVTYDDDYNVVSSELKDGVSGLVNHDTLGMTVDPFDVYDPLDPSSVRIYISHGEQFQNGGGAFTGPSYYTGQISVLTGPDFDNPVPIATGLPVSNHDHSVNGMHFDDNGDMLLCVGGNTNAGVQWPLIGDVPESPLSGAIVKLRLSDPAFNGVVLYEDSNSSILVDDQVFGEQVDVVAGVDIEVVAPGFRNTYDLVEHTNGYIYATDNGPNNPYGPASLSATTQGNLPHPTTPDSLDLVEPGNYYGSANRARGRYDERENVYRGNFVPSIPGEYVAPISLVDSSTNGIDEYRSAAFNEGMRGELIAMKWNSGIYRIELSEDGRRVDAQTLYSSGNSAFPPNRGLDVVTGPGGAILAISYVGNRVRVQVPDDVAAVGLTPYDITPWRAPATGGQHFVIGGKNFGTDLGAVTVTIGGIPAVLTSVSESRIRGIVPPSATGQDSELLDVTVQIDLNVRTLTKAFRYMPPTKGISRGRWRDASTLPIGLGDVVSAVLGGELYVFGDGASQTLAYDLVQDSWTTSHAVRPFTGGGHAAEVIDDKLYLFGGFDSGAAGKVQIYDPALDQWTLGTPMPWDAGGVSTATIDGIVYVAGGVAPMGGGTVGNFASYDPVADAWTSLGAMPTAVHMAASGTDGAEFFVLGGRQGTLSPQPGTSEVQIYDPVAATWRTTMGGQVGAMPLPRSSTGRAVFWNGELYVIGGADDVTTFAEVQVYDPATDAWRLDRGMPTARQAISPSIFQSRIFVHGGATVVGFGTLTTGEVLSPR